MKIKSKVVSVLLAAFLHQPFYAMVSVSDEENESQDESIEEVALELLPLDATREEMVDRLNTVTQIAAVNSNNLMGIAGAFSQIGADLQDEDSQGAVLGLDPLSEAQKSSVKILIKSKVYDFRNPQNPSHQRVVEGSGSGLIIEHGGEIKILTNAHVAEAALNLRVQEVEGNETCDVIVEHIAHPYDLALLKLEDEEDFENCFKGKTPLTFSDAMLENGDKVVVIGFPMGGEGQSRTKGIVSRIERGEYVQGYEENLHIQIDAAINPGNSGGPVFNPETGEVVGVAFQGINGGDNIGYIIPVSIVERFFKRIENQQVFGAPYIGIDVRKVSGSYREFQRLHGLTKGQNGLLIESISKLSPARKLLKKEDVIIAVDGHKIEGNSSVKLNGHLINWLQLIDEKVKDEDVELTVIRWNEETKFHEELSINVTFKNYVQNSQWMKVNVGDRPEYAVLGPFILSQVSSGMITSMAELGDLETIQVILGSIPSKEVKCFDQKCVIVANENDNKSLRAYSHHFAFDRLVSASVHRKKGDEFTMKIINLRSIPKLYEQLENWKEKLGEDFDLKIKFSGTEEKTSFIVSYKDLMKSTEKTMADHHLHKQFRFN